MKLEARFEGLERASDRLTKELRRVGKENSQKFVTLSLKMIEAQTSPFVPVDTSLLINSAYTLVRKFKSSTAMPGYIGTFGYGAEYAGYVHEGGPKNWKKGGASDKFLELGVEAFIAEDLDNLLQLLGD
jgi:hypothetical protein